MHFGQEGNRRLITNLYTSNHIKRIFAIFVMGFSFKNSGDNLIQLSQKVIRK